ncbi:MAG: hypothetical protein LBD05_02385, partial [Mycoplasmataceae bacterium]|nr:hypothetical protein [Mycoplasmataceae bacterium]
TCGGNTLSGVTWIINNFDGLNGKISINSTGTFSYDDTIANGSYNVTIKCTKTDYLDGTLTFTINVTSNQIVISGDATIEVDQNDSGSRTYTATCTADPTLTGATWGISDYGGLTNLSMNWSTGVFSWTSASTATAGNYTVIITCAKAPYTTGTFDIAFVINAVTPPDISYFITTGGVQYDFPYGTTAIDVVCNVDANGELTYSGYRGKIKAMHFGEDWDVLEYAPDNFCKYLFRNSSDVITNFNLPRNLISVGNDFCHSAFYFQTGFHRSLPIDFEIPQTITTAGTSFFLAFAMYTDLRFGGNLPGTFLDLPIVSASGTPYSTMFQGCSELIASGIPATPSGGNSYSIMRG